MASQTASAAQHFFELGNFAPVTDEVTATHLDVTGSIPPELSGCYLRNGPNPRLPQDHWFAGDGMVHGVRLHAGRAGGYRNRYVRTDSFEAPFPLYNADGTRNLHSSVANTHVVHHAGRTLALVESSLPYEIDSELRTLGCYDFGGKLSDSMTAHPKICPRTAEMHFFGYGNLREPYVTYHRASADGELIVEQPVDVPALTMMHDFCLTDEHVIFLDLPVVFDLSLARSGASLPYRWDDEYGARMGVMSRAHPAAPIQWFEIAPCYMFHTANAFRRGNTIVVTAVRHSEMWRTGGDDFSAPAHLWEWQLDLRTGRCSERQLDDVDVEFPRIDDARLGQADPTVYCVAGNALVGYDPSSGASVRHDFGPDRPGEATYVPGASGGYLLTYVYRAATGTSDLVILAAADLGGAPVAEVHLPQRVPNGFHGNWIPAGAEAG